MRSCNRRSPVSADFVQCIPSRTSGKYGCAGCQDKAVSTQGVLASIPTRLSCGIARTASQGSLVGWLHDSERTSPTVEYDGPATCSLPRTAGMCDGRAPLRPGAVLASLGRDSHQSRRAKLGCLAPSYSPMHVAIPRGIRASRSYASAPLMVVFRVCAHKHRTQPAPTARVGRVLRLVAHKSCANLSGTLCSRRRWLNGQRGCAFVPPASCTTRTRRPALLFLQRLGMQWSNTSALHACLSPESLGRNACRETLRAALSVPCLRRQSSRSMWDGLCAA